MAKKGKPPKNVRIDDFPTFERINTDPAIAIHPETGIVGITWTDFRAREADSNIFFARATRRSVRVFEASRQALSAAPTVNEVGAVREDRAPAS